VTPALFQRYPDAQTMAEAEEFEVLEYVKSFSYPYSKSYHLVEMAKSLVVRHRGEVTTDMNLLLDLPGVGRKTANVIQAVAFGRATMAVDTHVFRVSHRLGLVTKKDDTPLKVERMLMKHIPTEDIPKAHHWLLLHGRYVCTSRKPHCEKCELAAVCPKLIDGSKLE
jgi:endonuclease-3